MANMSTPNCVITCRDVMGSKANCVMTCRDVTLDRKFKLLTNVTFFYQSLYLISAEHSLHYETSWFILHATSTGSRMQYIMKDSNKSKTATLQKWHAFPLCLANHKPITPWTFISDLWQAALLPPPPPSFSFLSQSVLQ